MQSQPLASEPEASHLATMQVSTLSRRAWLGVVGLCTLTVGSLGLAWLMPDATVLHFLWVTQAVPVLYWLLTWWVTQSPASSDDAS